MKNFVANLMGVRVVCLIFCKIWTVFGYLLRKNMRLVSFIKIQFHFFQVESRVYIKPFKGFVTNGSVNSIFFSLIQNVNFW